MSLFVLKKMTGFYCGMLIVSRVQSREGIMGRVIVALGSGALATTIAAQQQGRKCMQSKSEPEIFPSARPSPHRCHTQATRMLLLRETRDGCVTGQQLLGVSRAPIWSDRRDREVSLAATSFDLCQVVEWPIARSPSPAVSLF